MLSFSFTNQAHVNMKQNIGSITPVCIGKLVKTEFMLINQDVRD